MGESVARTELVYERHIDQAVVDDVLRGGPASRILWRSVGQDLPCQATAFRGAVRSDGRETDVTIVGIDRFGTQRTLLVETKVGSAFGVDQARSYWHEVQLARGQHRDVRSVILAPAHWLESRHGVGCFDGRVTLESLVDGWRDEAQRCAEAAELVGSAIVVDADPRTMYFASCLRQLLDGTGCELYGGAMRRSTWADFRTPGGLRWKTDKGHLDLTAPGWDLESLAAHLAACSLPEALEAAPAGRSVVVRAQVGVVDVYDGFDEEVGKEVARLAEVVHTWVSHDPQGQQVLARPVS